VRRRADPDDPDMPNRIPIHRRLSLATVIVALASSVVVLLAGAAGASPAALYALGAVAVLLVGGAQPPRRNVPPLGPASYEGQNVSVAAPRASELVQRENGAAAA
jgi:hypothetical protein